MIAHWASGESVTPSAAATAQASASACLQRGAPLGSLRSSPTGRCVIAVAAARAASRASFSQRTAARCRRRGRRYPNAERLDAASASGIRGDRHDDVPGVGWTITPGRSSQASIRPMLRTDDSAARQAARGSSARARGRSAAGRPARRRLDTRSSASSRSGALTVTSRLDRLASRSTPRGRTVCTSLPCLRDSPCAAIARPCAGRAMQRRGRPPARPDGEHAADAARAEHGDGRSRCAGSTTRLTYFHSE